MYTAREYTVQPTIPEPLQRLRTLAMNLWWTWIPEAQALFSRLDPGLWTELQHNPVKLLNSIEQDRLHRVADDPAFLAHLDRIMDAFDRDMKERTWFEQRYPDLSGRWFAYFSAEFGLHESLPFYAGGLGVLAGDHLKSASDLGVPLVAVSLLYHRGYFHQRLSRDGRQFEEYPPVDLVNSPITPVTDDEGKPLKIDIELADHAIKAQIWRAQVGRVPLFLLDTCVQENREEDREITGELYGGDQELRIRQEVVLGIGGVRALRAVGIDPSVFHMNEGHCAFLTVERLRQLMKNEGLSFAEAREAVAGSTIFTTHTPVPAGIDTFGPRLVEKYLGPLAGQNGQVLDDLMALGQPDRTRDQEPFSMAGSCNGVSKLHASVARRMWHPLWKQLPQDEVPISAITNGIHIRTWQSQEMAQLFDRYLGPDWARDPNNLDVWGRIDSIPDAELWRAKERLREHLVSGARQHLKRRRQRRGASPAEIAAAEEALNPDTLTIGFARRFAPYKRSTLFLADPDRLTALLADEQRPIQFIFAGKAHPRDEHGKELIMKIVQFARSEGARRRVVFLDDYSIGIARILVHGSDVWLNNPIRMLEASGTSGMKVAPNGGINCSVLDGWWPEAYDGTNGWAIGDDQTYDSDEYQNRADADALYELLEREIIPMFYDRGDDGLPKRWIRMMKASMRTCCAQFSSNRMLRDYTERCYVPSAERSAQLVADGYGQARALAAWKQTIAERWEQVRVENVIAKDRPIHMIGDTISVEAAVRLGDIAPTDVAVELYHGLLTATGEITDGKATPMRQDGNCEDGIWRYKGELPCKTSGRHGFAVRVVAAYDNAPRAKETGLVCWG